MVEAGFIRTKNTANVLMKNLVDFMFGSILFSKKHREAQRNAEKRKGTQRSAKKRKETQRNTEKRKGTRRSAKERREAQRSKKNTKKPQRRQNA